MTLLSLFKGAIPYDARQRLKRKLFHVNDMVARLQNLRAAGFVCTGFIDGGAFEGEWTRQLWTIFPDAPSLMVEPLPEKQKMLRKIAGQVLGSSLVPAALGSAPGKVRFRMNETNSGVVDALDTGFGDVIEVRLASLDEIRENERAFWPNLLKLDLQGHELECLKGCSDLKAHFEVIVIEISLIPIGGAPLFTQVNNYLEQKGYRIYDVIPQYYRPLDHALFQVDAIYVRVDSSLLASTNWD